MIRNRIISRKGFYFLFFLFFFFFFRSTRMKNSAAIGPPWRFVLATKGRQYFAEMKEGRALLRFLPSLYFALSLENKGNLKGPEWLFIFSPPCLQRDWEFSLIRTVTGRIFANHSVSRICPLIVDNVPSSAREGASSLTLINKTNVPPLKITRTLFTIMQWTITDSLLELRKKYRWQNNRVATIKVKSWWNINRMAIVYTLSGSRVFVRGRIHGSMTLTFSPRILTRREKSREIHAFSISFVLRFCVNGCNKSLQIASYR